MVLTPSGQSLRLGPILLGSFHLFADFLCLLRLDDRLDDLWLDILFLRRLRRRDLPQLQLKVIVHPKVAALIDRLCRDRCLDLCEVLSVDLDLLNVKLLIILGPFL